MARVQVVFQSPSRGAGLSLERGPIVRPATVRHCEGRAASAGTRSLPRPSGSGCLLYFRLALSRLPAAILPGMRSTSETNDHASHVPGAARIARGAWLAAVLTLLLHLISNGRYGMFRDEFYYLACADHLAWGYVDHPPFSIAMLSAWRAIAGDSAWAIRLVPALLHAGVALAAADLARRLGGDRLAQTLAALTTGLMPGMLGTASVMSMNAWEIAIWTALVLVFCALLSDPSLLSGTKALLPESASPVDQREGRSRQPSPISDRARPGLWVLLGFLAGLGLLNKYGIAMALAGIAVGIVLSHLRTRLRTRWPWIAVAIACAMVLPHLLWQARHGWPTLEFMESARENKMIAFGPGAFWGQVVFFAHPLYAPVWLIGLAGLLFVRRLRRVRALAWTFVVPAIALTAGQGKPYYLAPAFPVLLAAGSVVITGWMSHLRVNVRRWTAAAILVSVLLFGLVTAPLTIPLLPVDAYVRYAKMLGVSPKLEERHAQGILPQHFADRFGWPELAGDVRRAWQSLSPEDRAECTILAGNYGEAGAISYFCREPGFPPVVSVHNAFYTWGPGDRSWDVVLAVGMSREDLTAFFAEVEPVGRHHHALAMPYEADLVIWLCRKPLGPVKEGWAAAKNYI